MATSLRIDCPKCGKQLSVPAELAGEVVACPCCSNQFRIRKAAPTKPVNPSGPSPPNPNYYPPGAVPAPPPGKSPPPRTGHGKRSGTSSRPSGTPPPGKASTTRRSKPPATAPAAKQPAAGSAPAKRSERPEASARRHTARFIERDANATQVQLGADGQLPDLALSTEQDRKAESEQSQSTNPLVLVAVLGVSVILSVFMLVVDQSSPQSTPAKTVARRTLQQVFDSWDREKPPNREIRDLLARAFQAYNCGDVSQEKKFYRQVMDILNREDAPKYEGYTGSDSRLKEALNELLR